MALIVKKFGGSSVANAERVFNVANIITEEYKKGNVSLDEALDLIKQHSRNYAKRQITFFKKYNLTKLQPDSAKNLAKTIIEGIHYDR